MAYLPIFDMCDSCLLLSSSRTGSYFLSVKQKVSKEFKKIRQLADPRFWPTRTSPFFRPSAHGVRQVVKARFSVSTTWRTFLFIRFFFNLREILSLVGVFTKKVLGFFYRLIPSKFLTLFL
jgi:hypothetical protein